VVQNTAQNSSDNLSSYPANSHDSSDIALLIEEQLVVSHYIKQV